MLGGLVAVTSDIRRLFRSSNDTVRLRAASMMLRHPAEVPLEVMLEILDELHDQGLGAYTERVLLEVDDSELVPAMIARLSAPEPFVRKVACTVIGRHGNSRVTYHLLDALADPVFMVRRAAAFALAALKDPSSEAALRAHYRRAKEDDINMRMALECALDALGATYVRHAP